MNNSAWYSLRRTLPSWRFDELLQELVAKAAEYKIDEVVVKVDTEEFSHGHPTIAWLKEYQPKLLQIKDALEKIGVIYSLNPWITVGHADRARNDYRHIADFQAVVGHDGSECTHCACPLSEGWRNHFKQLWTIYAETKPQVIWVEDDIRTFNHAPARYGCFCPAHLERFSGLIGKQVDREELVAAILQPGAPHLWRKIYLDMQAEIMIEVAAFIAKTVHSVSLLTSMGLMSSGPRQHCLEGRNWEKFCAALADGLPLYSRPPMCNYNENSLRGLYYSHDSIKLTRHAIPFQTIEQSEVENAPFTRFSKSINFTFLEMALSFAYGARGVTLNLYDHLGTPMSTEPEFGTMLSDKKDYLNALATAAQQSGEYRGIQLLYHPRNSYSKNLLPNSDYSELGADGYEMMLALENAGIATGYETSDAVAVSGQTLRDYNNVQINSLLKNGLLLDATAALTLFERGFGAEIGLANISKPQTRENFDFIICAEEYHNSDFGGAPSKNITACLPYMGAQGKFAAITPCQDATIVSSLLNPDAKRVAPMMVAFENRHGGRVIIHALDYQSCVGEAFHHPFRREQLQNAVRYLTRKLPELIFTPDGAYALAWRKDTEKYSLIGALNFNLDSWSRGVFEMRWNRNMPQVEMLNSNGEWQVAANTIIAQSNQLLQITCHGKFSLRIPLILKLNHALPQR